MHSLRTLSWFHTHAFDNGIKASQLIGFLLNRRSRMHIFREVSSRGLFLLQIFTGRQSIWGHPIINFSQDRFAFLLICELAAGVKTSKDASYEIILQLLHLANSTYKTLMFALKSPKSDVWMTFCCLVSITLGSKLIITTFLSHTIFFLNSLCLLQSPLCILFCMTLHQIFHSSILICSTRNSGNMRLM